MPATRLSLRVPNLTIIVLQIATLIASITVPILLSQNVNAAQLTSRSATVNNSQISVSGATNTIAFGYTLPTTANALQSIVYQFCTTPLGACTTPTSMVANTAAHSAQTGFPANATAFAAKTPNNTTVGDCAQGTAAAQYACFTRTDATTGGGAVTHTISTITNPSVVGTVYIRVTLYSTTAYATANIVDSGTVAVSYNQRLTVNARVQELLTFCIGTTTTNAVGANGANPILNNSAANVTSCSNADGTTVDVGVVGTTTAAVTPVATTSGGDARNAYALVLSNGVGGVVISYKAVQDAALGGRLKVTGQTCSGTSALDAGSSNIDQCFNSTSTQTALSAGVEQFGMTIAGNSCFIVPVAASGGYTCNYTAGNFNLAPQTGYIGAAANAFGTTNGFAWVQNGTITTIASSAASSIKQVYYEGLIIKFGAVSNATTPTGSYSALADFIATPTF